MMSNDKILRIVLASTVLLGLSWPAAAQQQAEGTVARLELNIAPFSAATEAGSVGRFDALEADEQDGDSTETAEPVTSGARARRVT